MSDINDLVARISKGDDVIEKRPRPLRALSRAIRGLHWDESKHNRVPAGRGDSSGEFAPKKGGSASNSRNSRDRMLADWHAKATPSRPKSSTSSTSRNSRDRMVAESRTKATPSRKWPKAVIDELASLNRAYLNATTTTRRREIQNQIAEVKRRAIAAGRGR